MALNLDYWDLPAVTPEQQARANAHGIDLYPHICAADEPHDVRRTLDYLIAEQEA